MFIHVRDDWTSFRWSDGEITLLLDKVSRAQGELYGRLTVLGFDGQVAAMADNLARDLVTSSEIEGVRLNSDEVRSSIARKLGLESVKYVPSSHYVDAVVSVMLDAVNNYDRPITKERLCAWQSAFFPGGFSDGAKIEVGQYRTFPEHIVSGMFGRERVHYIAPAPEKIDGEMAEFIAWFNSDLPVSGIIRSAIAHLWFVSIHPFEDGNGRLARILAEMLLAKSDNSKLRFYNISSEINRNKKSYYEMLERTQRGDGDITEWLKWYMQALLAAIDESKANLSTVLNKTVFWNNAVGKPLSDRQIKILNMFLDGYEAKITAKNWASLAKCSKDTAIRDIHDLVAKKLLKVDIPGAKRPSYSICYSAADAMDVDVTISEIDGTYYLEGAVNGLNVKERLLPLDAKRGLAGDLPMAHLVDKYCSYML